MSWQFWHDSTQRASDVDTNHIYIYMYIVFLEKGDVDLILSDVIVAKVYQCGIDDVFTVYSIYWEIDLLCLGICLLHYEPLEIYVIHLPIFFMITSLALGQSCDCPNASEVILKNMGKISAHLTTRKLNMNGMHTSHFVVYICMYVCIYVRTYIYTYIYRILPCPT